MWDLEHKESCCWRTDAFELWCWRRLLRVPWTARRSNQSILKEISPEYTLEELMLKLKLQYLGHLMRRMDSLEKTWCWEILKAGGEWDDREWGDWTVSPIWWTWVWASSGSWWWTGRPGVLQSMGSQRVWHDWVTELNSQVAQMVKNQSPNARETQEIWVWFLGQENYSLLENPMDRGTW